MAFADHFPQIPHGNVQLRLVQQSRAHDARLGRVCDADDCLGAVTRGADSTVPRLEEIFGDERLLVVVISWDVFACLISTLKTLQLLLVECTAHPFMLKLSADLVATNALVLVSIGSIHHDLHHSQF